MFQHILVPLDGSSCAEQALPLAAQIARTTKARITLLRIQRIPVEYLSSVGAGGAMVYSEDMIDIDEQVAMDYLKDIVRAKLFEGLVIDKEVVVGEAFPAGTLVESGQRNHVDLMVMCSHGNTGFKRFVLGSVAHQLVHHHVVPVLVLQQEKNAEPLVERVPIHQPYRCLVPLDGTGLAEKALQPAAQLSAVLSWPAPGKIHLVRVVEPGKAQNTDNEQKYLNTFKEQLGTLVYQGQKLEVSTSLLTGKHVAETLTTYLNTEGDQTAPAFEAIALATHGRHGFAYLFQGSITEQIMDHIKLPMLIIPQKSAMEQTAQQKDVTSPNVALL